jgi:hypothetical protein
MLGLQRDRAQDQQIERALHQIVWLTHLQIIYKCDCR